LEFERPAAFLWCSRPSLSWSSTSAKSLGLTIPSEVAAIADEVIEYLIMHRTVGIASRYMLRGPRVSLQSDLAFSHKLGHSRRFSDVFRYFIAKGVQRGDNL
jgi:hypothetical protein